MNTKRFAALAMLAVAVSCSDASSDPTGLKADSAAKTTDLESARQRWRAQDLHTYAFLLQRSCFCGNTHPLFVAVVNDKVAAVLDFETLEGIDPKNGQTVDELFKFIETAVNRPARLIRATYDATKGFPTEIDYDGEAQIADDEIFYRVSDVHPIAPPREGTLVSPDRLP